MDTSYMLEIGTARCRVSLHDPAHRPEGEVGGSEAIILIDDDTTVLVREEGGRLNTPGDRPQMGESLADAATRAVREKACAEVIGIAPIAYTRTERLGGPDAGKIIVGCMHIARVTLLPWVASAGIEERVEVSLADLAATMSADWIGLEDFSNELVRLAAEALPRL